VLLTFDDGGAGAILIGELLTERGWCGHLFMPTDFIGLSGFLGRSELRALHGMGHVIGSHSASHPIRIDRLPWAELREEWRRSVGVLEDLLGVRATTASVPGGFFTRRVADAAVESGINQVFTSEPSSVVRRTATGVVLGRYTLRKQHTARYVSRLVSQVPTARSLQWLHWNAKKIGKRVAGGAYRRIREWRFDE
jgi:peptidoglycan/xylan/chitin deacetylase (PgdA/CDA1 family)